LFLKNVIHVASHDDHYSMCSKCPSLARTQAVDVDATRALNMDA